jgi:hypothetical protein
VFREFAHDAHLRSGSEQGGCRAIDDLALPSLKGVAPEAAPDANAHHKIAGLPPAARDGNSAGCPSYGGPNTSQLVRFTKVSAAITQMLVLASVFDAGEEPFELGDRIFARAFDRSQKSERRSTSGSKVGCIDYNKPPTHPIRVRIATYNRSGRRRDGVGRYNNRTLACDEDGTLITCRWYILWYDLGEDPTLTQINHFEHLFTSS